MKIKEIIQTQNIKQDLAKILMVVGIWLRGRGLDSPLWYDEAFSINVSRLPLPYMVRATWLDFTPVLHYLIIKPFAWLENVPWLARIPSLLFSILALAVVWEMLDDWEVTDNQRLWISALTLLPGFYWMAQDARVYALLGLLYLLSFWLMQSGQYRWAVVTMTLMIWSHPTGLIFTVSIVVVCLARDWLIQGLLNVREIYKSSARLSILTGLVALLAGIPALLPILTGPVADHYLMIPVSVGQVLTSIYTAVFVGTMPPAGLLVIVFYLVMALAVLVVVVSDWLMIIRTTDCHNPDYKMGLIIEDDIVVTNGLLVIIPTTLLLLISLISEPIFFYRPLMPLLYPLIIWIGSATALKEYRPYKLIAPALLAAMIILANINWSPGIKGSDLDKYTGLISQEPESSILYATGTAALPFDLYLTNPSWIAESENHNSLGSRELMELFGWEYQDPGSWADWIIWPRDPLLDPDLFQQLEVLTAENYELVGVVEYWHIEDVEIWRAEQ